MIIKSKIISIFLLNDHMIRYYFDAYLYIHMSQIDKKKWAIGPSKIHGSGIIANCNIKEHEIVDVGIDYWMGIIPYVTPHFGSWINHCENANTHLIYFGKHYIVSQKPIKRGEELTVNYNLTPWYIDRAKPWYTSC